MILHFSTANPWCSSLLYIPLVRHIKCEMLPPPPPPPPTSSTTYTPPSLRIQLWLSALSHISAHQIVVNRFAFTLVYGTGKTSPCRSGRGRLDRNPSSKCVRCILALWRFYQIQCISVAGVNGGPKSPFYSSHLHFLQSKFFSQADLVLLPVPGKKTCVFHTVSVVLVLTSPACVRNFAK